MKEKQNFTQGRILSSLVLFALPVLLALFLGGLFVPVYVAARRYE